MVDCAWSNPHMGRVEVMPHLLLTYLPTRSSDAVTADLATGSKLSWSELDAKAVDTVRVLAMDAVEKAGNGHPGTAMSLAPAAYLLFQKVLRHDPPTRSGSGATGSCCRPVTPASPFTFSSTCPDMG
jgi:hypothetical protein